MSGDWRPGRWWQVLAPDGTMWCETSDEEEARAALRPGDTLWRLWQKIDSKWVRIEQDPAPQHEVVQVQRDVL